MIPTDTHLTLLRQLPVEVKKKLRAHGPGWAGSAVGGQHFWHSDPWAEYRGNDAKKPGQAGLLTLFWLPCDPTAILQTVGEIHDTRGWGYCISMEVSKRPDHVWATLVSAAENGACRGEGDDPHEAALQLLIAVCGGEE